MFLAVLVLVGLCVIGMCVGIIFHRGFPKYDVGSNPEMRKRGISCYKDEDARIRKEVLSGSKSAGCTGEYSDACEGCAFFEIENFYSKEDTK